VSKRDRLKLTPDLLTRWATGNDNFVYSSLWDFKSSFACRKILRHGIFPLYFPSERKVCCGLIEVRSPAGARIFPLTSVCRPALGPTQPPVQWVTGVPSLGVKRGRGVTLTTHPHLVPRSRMSRSYTFSPPSAFMACRGTALLFTFYWILPRVR
jgi:hypothetical protein